MNVMRQFPDNCIDTIITDPPYGLEFMGKNWDHGLPGEIYWYEALRVVKPGAILLAFGGTRTYHRLTCAIEDAGWEIRDCIMWIYGSGFPKSHNVSKAIDKEKGMEREVVGENPYNTIRGIGSPSWGNGKLKSMQGESLITAPSTPLAHTFDGYGSALKPAYEPIVVAMKPLDGTYANNAEKWGVSGLWIDGGRIGTEQTKTHMKDMTPYHGNNFGNPEVSVIITGEKLNPPGRWPANVIHDGSDEVLAEFPLTGSTSRPNLEGKIINGVSTGKTIYGKFSPRSRHTILTDNGGSASRFFYCAKASSNERGSNNNHPTVKPLSLLRYLCRLTRTPTGGIVLDPFAGSGTTALAAIAEKRDFILIEKEPEYAEICRQRIAEYTGMKIVPKEVKVKDETIKQMALW